MACESDVWTIVSALGTAASALFAGLSALAVYFVWRQLILTKEISQRQFEDGLAKEYRELASRIPTGALLGSGLSPDQYAKSFDEFFRYVDLSNEQVMLRMHGRVSPEVWESWKSGIRFNLSLPTFSRAWSEIQRRNSSQFSELGRLEAEAFAVDPADWGKQ